MLKISINHLIFRCILNHLSSKIRILVTHQIQFIEKANKILILKEGQCMAYGSYQKIQEKGIDFVSLLASTNDGKENGPMMNQTQSISMLSIENSLSSLHGTTPIHLLEVGNINKKLAS